MVYLDNHEYAPSPEDQKLIEADMFWSFTLMIDPLKKYFKSEDGHGEGAT